MEPDDSVPILGPSPPYPWPPWAPPRLKDWFVAEVFTQRVGLWATYIDFVIERASKRGPRRLAQGRDRFEDGAG